MITKISKIHNFGVFKNFNWDRALATSNGITTFNKVNIIYGRNYAGKTTISRIIRSIEKGFLYPKHTQATFNVEMDDGKIITERDLDTPDTNLRIFNVDFIKENLMWLIDEKGEINAFAILGEENIEIENKIKSLNTLRGNDECGLARDLRLFTEKSTEIKLRIKKTTDSIDDKLRAKAKSIKERAATFGDVNYNINSIKADLVTIGTDEKHILEKAPLDAYSSILSENIKPPLSEINHPTTNTDFIYNKCISALERKVSPSNSIKELIENKELQEWVRTGSLLHRGSMDHCAFCGKTLTAEDWKRIDDHFNKSSEDLRQELQEITLIIDNERSTLSKIQIPDAKLAYSTFANDVIIKSKELAENTSQHVEYLTKLKKLIQEKAENIFSYTPFKVEKLDTTITLGLIKSLNSTIKENNSFSSELDNKKRQSRTALRLHEVASFARDTRIFNELENTKELETSLTITERKKLELQTKIHSIDREITTLNSQLKDEGRGAEKVNSYLNHYFGCDSLSFSAEKADSTYKFKLQRNGKPAFDLSEGERSLVAFCYFMAKLQDVDSNGKNLVIWIDDPISSLDSSHTFFIYSMIENLIAKPKNFDQLTISTHNLDFLKYLKKLTIPTKKINGKKVHLQENFFILNTNGESTLKSMPRYLKEYITEFNFLFNIIYKCATLDICTANHEHYYNFGNNLRKFLESYLFYRYPDSSSLRQKILLFFDGDGTSTSLVERVVHEYSHLGEAVDRCMQPIEIPEIKKIAAYVLNKIELKDPDQYKSLIQSISE